MNEELHTLPDAQHAGDTPVQTFDTANAAPLRADVFSAAQMAVHGRQLAARHVPAREPGPDTLLARLADNAAAIARTTTAFTRAARGGDSLAAAAEALLEQQDLIDEHVRFARASLPKKLRRTLPFQAVPLEPRIYQLALEAVAHGDGRLEHETLACLVAGYQQGAPLALGELRAFPAMLRLALVENLRRIATRLEDRRTQRLLARHWAERMQDTAETRPGDLVLLMADMARTVQPMDAAFAAELAHRLEGREGPLDQVLQWLGTRLADEGAALGERVEQDAFEDAADAVSLANSLASLRRLATVDWQAFLETSSAVEGALRQDPAAVYARMDFASREHYRAGVERLAQQSGRPEGEVAAEALALAAGGVDERTRHVGHYLIGDGRPLLREKLGQLPGMRLALRRAARRRPLASWLGAVGLFTLLFTAALVVHAWRNGAGASLMLVIGLLAACGASQLALALVELMVGRLVAPRPLPRMDFSGGIPAQSRSMVVVTAVPASAQDAAALCRGLELRYLANRDPNLRFCLLLDGADAPADTMPGDASLLDAARGAVAALNARYPDTAPFLLLCRRRVWSSSEGAWIGRERKRGALADLNAFLRGGARERFSVAEGHADGIRYVITQDADTILPRDAARRMVAAMAHPLNQPVLSADGRRVVAGHGLLQPRVTGSLPLDGSSRYGRLCSGEPGIDLGPRPVPNLWQDLFGEGVAGGQGIYEVDTFSRVLAGLPENAVLSHDLLATCCLRGGLLNDVQVCQPAPGRFRDAMERRHRQVRGDWQLAGWLRTRVKGADGACQPNPFGPLARWQLFDALRRSLVAPTLTSMLVLCWARLPSPAFWSAAALSVFFLPAFIAMLVQLVDRPHDTPWRQHLHNWGQDARLGLRRAVMHTAVLPYEAWTSLDAIARAAWRLLVSRRRLLERKPPAPKRPGSEIELNVRRMWFAPALSACVAVLLTFLHPFALFAAAPLLLLWFLSPVIAWWVSLPSERTAPPLSDPQALFLAALARRTWSFFETFIGPQDNWLPPDSMQEHPHPTLMHRTSPTDMGVALLANLAAWDFGFIPQAAVLARVGGAFDSMALLERHRGHFCSWYDTATLAPLQPMTVSTLDSGNLAAHLLTLAAGIEALADAPVASAQSLAGMRATLQVLDEHAKDAPAPVREAIARCRSALEPGRKADTLPELTECLQGAAQAAASLLQAVPADAGAGLADWSTRFEADCRAARDDLLALAPWMRAVQEYVFEASLTRIPTLRELAAYTMQPGADDAERALAAMVEEGAATARSRLDDIAALAQRAREFADMDFGLLYQEDTGLLASGYNVSDGVLETDSCELLAAETRLASFIGIARGQLPLQHWFALKRPLGITGGEQLLLSKNGALSDYLAPLLVMPACRGTLFDKTCAAAVRAQADWADRHEIPWGMSESGYNVFDEAMNYGYGTFGVPGAGVKRGLGDDLVVAPYASMLALMVAPEAACANLERMAGLGLMGQYGFHEAVDYTRARLPRGQKHAVVRSFMAHHQGMGLLALSQLLHGRPMEKRFGADAAVAATLPLLYERVPKSGAFDVAWVEAGALHAAPMQAASLPRAVDHADATQPEVQLLSNGRYHVMVTSDGAGYSRWGDQLVTRWRADPTALDAGVACRLRDLDSGALWSNTFQPTLAPAGHYEALFPEGRAEFRRVDDGIDLVTEIVVALDDDVELRRTRIRNMSGRARRIEVTTWVDIAQAPLQRETLAERGAILCPRAPGIDDGPSLLNLLAVHGGAPSAASFAADGMQLSRTLTLAAGEEAIVDFALGVAPTRDEALLLIDKYGDCDATERAFELAWTQSQALLRQQGVSEPDAALYARLAGAVLYPGRALRAPGAVVARNRLGQPGLWPYGISGDLPVVLAQVHNNAGLGLVRQLVQAQAYWRQRGLAVDLVVWYADALQGQVARLAAAGAEAGDGAGGIFAFAVDGIPEDDRVLMQSVARVLLVDKRGSLREQLRRAFASKPAAALPLLPAAVQAPEWSAPAAALPVLQFGDGNSGFTSDGCEYVVRTAPGQAVPAPCANVLANPVFASVVSASGQAGTCSAGAHDLRLTPAGEDSACGGEAFYLRDEASGVFWSPAALPAPSGGDYLARHGFGYSVFEHTAHGIRSDMTCFVALDAPVKYTVLTVRNDSAAPRRLSATGYVDWVLGQLRAVSAPHVVTERDPASGALVARSSWQADVADVAAFFHVADHDAAFTCDRMEFIGRNRSLASPQALGRAGLSGALGAALDPCAALQVAFELAPGEQKELVFMLGAVRKLDTAGFIEGHGDAAQALARVRAWWSDTLGAVRVETPDPALDVLANGWLPYQAIGRGMWARDRGGGWRFRDDLQDAMALVHARPQLLRERLLLCAAHQFIEGGLRRPGQPPSHRSVRMRAASDLLWLPLAACRYVGATGDVGVLGESVPWLEERALEPGADAGAGLADGVKGHGDLYGHCVRAIREAMHFGEHGLPLDGDAGGESAWLGFFMTAVLRAFAEVADRRADYGFATTCRAAALALAAQLKEHAWDGEAYRSDAVDKGELALDPDVQSWAVLSGAASPGRAACAMAAADAQLARGEARASESVAWAAMAFARLGQGARAWELLDILNPLRQAPAEDARNRPEPYVAPGVVFGPPPIGRASLNWYTGAAGPLYRLIVESLLGIERAGQQLVLAPQLPQGWPGFRVQYRYRGTVYAIEVRAAQSDALLVDGHETGGNTVQLVDDGVSHRVELRVARRQEPAVSAEHEEPQSKTIP